MRLEEVSEAVAKYLNIPEAHRLKCNKDYSLGCGLGEGVCTEYSGAKDPVEHRKKRNTITTAKTHDFKSFTETHRSNDPALCIWDYWIASGPKRRPCTGDVYRFEQSPQAHHS